MRGRTRSSSASTPGVCFPHQADRDYNSLEYASYIDSDADCFRILRCVHCGVVYDRDYVGSSNIAQILLFKLATGFHLYERNVEEVLGLGLRDGHKSKEERKMKKKASVKGKEKAE